MKRSGVPKARRPKADLRASLVRAARRIVEQRGKSALTLRTLAKGVRRSHTALFLHFDTLQDVMAAVAADGWSELRVELEGRAALPPGEGLQMLAKTYTGFAMAHPQLFRLMYDAELWNAVRADRAGAYARMEAERNQCFLQFIDVVVDGQVAGAFRSGNPDELARLPAALSHGLAMEFLDERLHVRKEVDRLMQLAIEGLGEAVNR